MKNVMKIYKYANDGFFISSDGQEWFHVCGSKTLGIFRAFDRASWSMESDPLTFLILTGHDVEVVLERAHRLSKEGGCVYCMFDGVNYV